MTNKTLKEILISLSLANLLYLASWRELLYPATFDYHVKFGPKSFDYLSVILCVALTAGCVFGTLRAFRYFCGERVRPLIELTFLLACLIAVNIFRVQFINATSAAAIGLIFQITFLAALAVLLTRWKNTLLEFAKTFVLMLSPFVLITFSQAFSGVIYHDAETADEVPVSQQLADVAPNAASKIKSRVVWIIFDELDYRVPFELNAVELPEFQRLRAESLSATQATSPAWSTLNSLPSLLTGRKVGQSEPLGKNDLILNFADGANGKFSQEPNLFFDVKQLSGNISVLGWHHPYCRLFGQVLSVCKWEGEKFSGNLSLIETMRGNLEDLVLQIPAIFNLYSEPAKNRFTKDSHHVFTESEYDPLLIDAAHRQRLGEIKEMAANPNLDLVFFHLPLPHAPVQYDRFAKKFTAERQDYINNLALCDIILGEIRRSMEQANQWETSTVIVSSDHQWRVKTWKDQTKAFKFALTDNDLQLTQGIEDPRVPFLIKLKNQKESVSYDKPFNTVVSRELILAVMKGEISSTEELKTRLDKLGSAD